MSLDRAGTKLSISAVRVMCSCGNSFQLVCRTTILTHQSSCASAGVYGSFPVWRSRRDSPVGLVWEFVGQWFYLVNQGQFAVVWGAVLMEGETLTACLSAMVVTPIICSKSPAIGTDSSQSSLWGIDAALSRMTLPERPHVTHGCSDCSVDLHTSRPCSPAVNVRRAEYHAVVISYANICCTHSDYTIQNEVNSVLYWTQYK